MVEATPQQGSESWGSFTQKEHDEMSYGEASMCEGAWSVQGAKERPPRLEKTKGAGSERRRHERHACPWEVIRLFYAGKWHS